MTKILFKILQFFIKKTSSPKERFSGTFQSFNNEFLYTEREKILLFATEFIKYSELKGDYLEFGVWEGKTLAAAYHFSKNYGFDTVNFYAFDGFKGLPEIKGIDKSGFKNFHEGQYSCNKKQFEKNLIKYGVDSSKVFTIEGWFEDILNNETKKKLLLKYASIIWIDCDLYESTVPVLNFIESYIQDGTVLIFDDWFCYRSDPKRGEQRAFNEWMEKNPHITAIPFRQFSWHGNSFILRIQRDVIS